MLGGIATITLLHHQGKWSRRLGEREEGSLTARAVKETVASLDRVVDRVGASGIVDLPQPEADLRHLVATVELDVRDRHCDNGSAAD